MRFDTGDPQPNPTGVVQVGDVFMARGGMLPDYWVVVAVRDNSLCLLGIKANGDIVSAQNYGIRNFESRARIGVVEDLKDFTLNVQWLGRAP